MKKVELEFHGRPLSVETGRLAKQAGGSALVTYGDTVILVTAVGAKDPRPGVDFLPLTCEYQEKTYAAGKIPGGFFKREGRPTEKETLTCRLMDRPIRPLFPKGWRCETQVIATVLSADRDADSDYLAITGASTALHLSEIPFDGPIAAVRMGRVGGELVVNPTTDQLDESDLNITVACSREAILMVEGGGREVPEDVLLDALFAAHDAVQPLLDLQDELRSALGKEKREFTPAPVDENLVAKVEKLAVPKIEEALSYTEKFARNDRLRDAGKEVVEGLAEDFPEREAEITGAYESVQKKLFRKIIVEKSQRVDGRGLKDVRPISIDLGMLPRAHGSAVFTRGETQALVVVTLGTSSDEQRIDALLGEYYRRFMLHYNFPPFCVGEARFLRGPSRRDIGHGALAERALLPVIPADDTFPYAIRLVSEILESNGSSSMATVCGGSLAMMDAGVPTKAAVAGVAMGLIKEGDEVRVLSDILGDEDHLGDMDFKVAGTGEGVTAVQMDNKVGGVSRDIMRDALLQAREARLHILGEMAKAITAPRDKMSAYAPQIVTLKIPVDKIRDVIGPGGKVIRSIVEETGAKIDVEDDGTVRIASSDQASLDAAREKIEGLTAMPEVGRIYKGLVRKVMDFGAFVQILPNTDGLCHISQLAPHRVAKVEDIVREGDEVMVKVLEIQRDGRIRLSRKEAIAELQTSEEGEEAPADS